MDERREPSPTADTPRPATAAPARLSPLQAAWADYTRHTASCAHCRTRGGVRCEEAGRLWQAHRDLCDDAYEQLSASDR